VGREADLQRLDDHAARGEGPPLVVHGESGCGKTALVANWLARYRRANPQARTFAHYLGSTADSADPWQMIRRLLQTLKEWGTWEEDIPAEREELEEKLPLALASAGHKEPVVIIIDGLNQVLEAGRDLRWLPWHTPPGVRLVLSVIPGECLDLLLQREWPMQEVPQLSADLQREVAAQYLGRFRKKLPEELLNELVAAPPTANPLYLKVLLDEMRVFGEHEQLAQKLRWYLEATTPEAVVTLLYFVSLSCSVSQIARTWASTSSSSCSRYPVQRSTRPASSASPSSLSIHGCDSFTYAEKSSLHEAQSPSGSSKANTQSLIDRRLSVCFTVRLFPPLKL